MSSEAEAQSKYDVDPNNQLSRKEAGDWCTKNKCHLADVTSANIAELAELLKKKKVEKAWVASWNGAPEDCLVLYANKSVGEEPCGDKLPFITQK
jgi:hypothetical protein